jgi:hypothetical protein
MPVIIQMFKIKRAGNPVSAAVSVLSVPLKNLFLTSTGQRLHNG